MNIRYDFSGQVVVVTGGGSGIGAALCKAVAESGGIAIAADINREGTERVAAAAGGPGKVEPRTLDVSDPDQVDRVFGEILQSFGKVDALVHGAAIQPRASVMEMDRKTWRHVLEVNLSSALYCAQAVIPGMIERRRGSIVTFTSGLASQGWAKASAYAATKAGLIAFTKSLAKELLPYRVRANVIAPGITNSPLFTEPNTPEEQEYFRVRAGGVGVPEDVVPLLMFLISDQSASLSGSVLDRVLILPPAAI